MTCDSCGADGVEVLPVHRTYLLTADEPAPSGATAGRTLDEIEHWCFACRTHYPHDDA